MSIFDVSDKIKTGENLISAECKNISGPAGLMCGLLVIDEKDGSWATATDKTWKYSLKKEKDWLEESLDDKSWKTAKEIGTYGSKPWRERVDFCNNWQNLPIEILSINNHSNATFENIRTDWGLKPIDSTVPIARQGNIVAGLSNAPSEKWKTLILSLNLERCSESGYINILKSEFFAKFIIRNILWACSSAMDTSKHNWIIPDTSHWTLIKNNSFPVAMQFSRLPFQYDPLRRRNDKELSNVKDTQLIINEIKKNGFTSLSINIDHSLSKSTLSYAMLQGLDLTFFLAESELFGRNAPPETCVYSDKYEAAVEKNYLKRTEILKSWPPVSRMFPYLDEPFHAGIKSFGYNKEIFEEFKKRYGYEMPPDMESARKEPRKWLDVINFRSDYFPDAWRKVYKIIKKHNPGIEIIMTHDSHNSFGAGVKQQAQIAIDDVFHWGGDFADIFMFDIYPYMAVDFRYGENRKLPKPRISQTHYAMAQMRNLTRHYNKKLGFWFGTYNSEWFQLDLENRREKYWTENEMCYTAIANDSDFLCAGKNIPENEKHWDTLGKGLNIIQKVGKRLLETRQMKAKAAFLFPRTQYIQLQEECWNVGMSFEAFLRAFGELDVIHEEQIKDPSLNGYDILVLYDVKLLPAKTAENIAQFVRNGGIVIADCVPVMDEYMKPMKTMEELFGVTNPVTDRIMQKGAYVSLQSDVNELKSEKQSKSEEIKKASISGSAFGKDFNFTAVSPRSCEAGGGEVLLCSDKNIPALIRKKTEKGSAYLLGFCLQDSYFNTYKENDAASRDNIYDLLSLIAKDAGVQAHIHSSNPDIEAAVRTNNKEAFLFVISHEAPDNNTTITLSDIPFEVKEIRDLKTYSLLPFKKENGRIVLKVSVPDSTRTCLLNIR